MPHQQQQQQVMPITPQELPRALPPVPTGYIQPPPQAILVQPQQPQPSPYPQFVLYHNPQLQQGGDTLSLVPIIACLKDPQP
ncbi:unnamed protein product, partial [Amoebophrya sp. A25]|eukprot:GSA25T00023488001.1